jgi:hypothetical protein
MSNGCPLGYGSRTGYQKHKCRCDECTEANADYQRGRREQGGRLRDDRRIRAREVELAEQARAERESRWTDEVREAHARINAAFGLGQARQDEVA